jgi:hypothetical protein
MTLAAAGAALLVGSDASPQQYAQPQYAKTPLAYRVRQEQPKPAETPLQEKQQEPKPQDPQPLNKTIKETELERLASQAYLEGKKLYEANKVEESRPYFLEARKRYEEAEAAVPGSDNYAEERKNIVEWISVSHYNKLVASLNAEEKSGLDKLLGIEKPAEPKIEKPGVPQPQDQPRPKANLEEVRLETSATEAYTNGLKAEQSDKDAALRHFLESRKLYKQAEAADPASEKYSGEISNATNRIVSARYNGKQLQELNVAELNDLAVLLEKYEKEGAVLPPMQPVPEPKPQDSPKDTIPAEPKSGPFNNDLLSLKAGLGPYHRAAGAYLNIDSVGIEALLDFKRDKFDLSDTDDLERKHIGLYTEADFNKMFGVPLRAHIAGEQFEEILNSFSSDVTEDASFRITTSTRSRTTTTRDFLDIGGELRLGDYGILAELFQLEEDIGVDVTTLLDVVNKLDPAGSFTDTILSSQSFRNTTRGFQAGPKAYFLDDRVSAGILFTYEDTDMPDFNRSTRRLRWHPFLGFLSEKKDWGFYAIGGESLLKDGGERLTAAEYAAVIGARLSNRVVMAGRVSSRERDRTRGMLTLIYCKDNESLEHLLENERIKLHDDLNLIKNISPNLIAEYLTARDDQILRWIAGKEGWKFRIEGGAARVVRDNGEVEVVPMYGADLLTPVFWNAVTLGAGFKRFEGDESETTQVNLYVLPKDKDWQIKLVGEQEEIEGLGVRDRRAFVAFDYLFGSGRK